MRSAPRFVPWKATCHPPLHAETCCQPPCVQSDRHPHTVLSCRRSAVGRAGSDAVWWSGAGTGERSPILRDGTLMNASSVLPMAPPCSSEASPFRLPSFVHGDPWGGGPWGPYAPLYQQSLSLCALCVVCASLAPVLKSRPPLLPNRHTPLRVDTHSLSPGPCGPGPR